VATTASAAAMTWQRTESTSLYLTTQEGDVVELNVMARDRASASAAQASDGSTEVAQFDLSSSSKLKLSFSVKGDLNSDELAAISDVVAQVGELADDFFNGGLPEAFATAESMAIDGSQLATVALRMSVREQFTYSGAAFGPTIKALPSRMPMTQAAFPAMSSAPPAPVDTRSEDASTAAETATSEPKAAVTATPRAPTATGNALDLVRGFLGKLMNTLGDEGGKTGTVDFSLKLKMFQSAVTSISVARVEPKAEAPEPLPALVPDTLDAIAAKQAPPLQAVA
ncbi:MAG: hypothetical protein AB7P42_18495, partial [Gammaproteobacteria bacterium]